MIETAPMMRPVFWPRIIACLFALQGATLGWCSTLQESMDPEDRSALIQQLTTTPAFLAPIAPPSSTFPASKCIQWGDVFYMMPGSMTESQAMQFVDSLPALPRERRYQPVNYWTKTATDGRVTIPGQRITITWSIVPDGTLLYSTYAEGFLPSNMHASMSTRFASEQLWKDQFRRAFAEFGELIGVNYVEVSDDGANQPAVGLLGVRGDVRIGMIQMPTPGPLAYNFLPTQAGNLGSVLEGYGGDMTFNSSYMNLHAQTANSYRYLRNIIMHEHGHGIGFDHVGPINGTKLMEPYLIDTFDGPQEDDIRGFQAAYGDRLEPNNTAATATVLPPLPRQPGQSPLVYEALALEHSQARDYFVVDVPELTILRVNVEPVGAFYSQGPVSGPFGNINGREVLDLAIDVMNAEGTVILDSVDKEGPGGIELARTPLMMGSGQYTFRVRSKGVSGLPQRYRMWVSRLVGEIDAVYREEAILVDDSAGNASGGADPGERDIDIFVPLRNEGFSFGTAFPATLVSETPTVTVTHPLVHYGVAHAGEIAEQDEPFRFNVSPQHACGDPIVFRLMLEVPNRPQELAMEIGTGITGLGPLRQYASTGPGLGPLHYLSSSSIVVDSNFPVGTVRIANLNVTGSGLENHRLTLRSPSGQQVVLSDGDFRGTNLRNTQLADDGRAISAGLAPYTGTFRPVNSFVGVMGEAPVGEWRLTVLNKLGARAATIDTWTLELAPIYEGTVCDAPILPPLETIESLSIY